MRHGAVPERVGQVSAVVLAVLCIVLRRVVRLPGLSWLPVFPGALGDGPGSWAICFFEHAKAILLFGTGGLTVTYFCCS